MASNCTNISFLSYNINGFARIRDFIYSVCNDNPLSIIALQEHWLRPPYKKQQGVNVLRVVHPNFDGFGSSAMKKASEEKIIKGRPYGGTTFIFDKSFSECLKPVLSYSQ